MKISSTYFPGKRLVAPVRIAIFMQTSRAEKRYPRRFNGPTFYVFDVRGGKVTRRSTERCFANEKAIKRVLRSRRVFQLSGPFDSALQELNDKIRSYGRLHTLCAPFANFLERGKLKERDFHEINRVYGMQSAPWYRGELVSFLLTEDRYCIPPSINVFHRYRGPCRIEWRRRLESRRTSRYRCVSIETFRDRYFV